MKSTLRMFAIATASGAVIALTLTGIAWAITSNVFQYSAEKTGWLMIQPAAMMPDAPTTVEWTNVSDSALQGTDASTIVCLNAPVDLPQSSRLAALAVWYSRADVTGFVSYSFVRRHVPDGTQNTIVANNAPASGNMKTVANTNITDPDLQTIDNRLYIYWLHMCLRSGGTFWGARVTYKYTNAGD